MGTVSLQRAHETWAHEFEPEKARLVAVIGEHIIDIQHVGSTSIPGVPAKPILDILIGVEDYDRAFECIPPIENLGYEHRGEYGIPRRHYFVTGEPRTHHIHMFEHGKENWRVILTFRDFLRTHEETAREYAEAKIALAAKHAQDRSAYQEEKDKVVERLLKRILA